MSIKDVAARAGVSVGTVSNVLNRPERVAGDTRERVLAAIGELGFVRSEPARQLRAGRSRTVGLVIPDAADPVHADIARGAEEAAAEHGLALVQCSSRQSAARERAYLGLMAEQRVNGVLLAPVGTRPPEVEALLGHRIPVILLDRTSRDRSLCSVWVDHRHGGGLAVDHLAGLGHRRIGFVGPRDGRPQVRARLGGARAALRGHDLDPRALIVIDTEDCSLTAGHRAATALLALPAPSRPTAVFCADDLLALGLLAEVVGHGLDVPGDLAVVGYDDIGFATSAAVPLSSVRRPQWQLGHTAGRLLIEEGAGGPGHEHRQVRFEPSLVCRRSSLREARGTAASGPAERDGR